MRRFRFSLESALRVRVRFEEQAQVELAARRRTHAIEETQLGELCEDLRRHDAGSTPGRRAMLDVLHLADSDRYREALSRAILMQEQRVLKASLAVAEAREMLHRRRTDRETLERLREKQFEAHREETLREEQRDLDEISVTRWQREPV